MAINDALTRREEQVAELIAWGAAYKEVPDLLKKKYGGKEISVNTVKRIVENIFSKLYIGKSNELSAWWFCNKLGVDSNLSPLKDIKRAIYSIVFLIIVMPQILSADLDQATRTSRSSRTTRIERVQRSRRKEDGNE